MRVSKQIQFDRLSEADTDEVFEVWSDLETIKHTNWTHTPTRDECVQRMEKVLAFYGQQPLHFGPYTIRTEEGRFLGLVGADLGDEAARVYDVWYVLRRDTWGNGIGTRVLGQLLEQMAKSGRVNKA